MREIVSGDDLDEILCTASSVALIMWNLVRSDGAEWIGRRKMSSWYSGVGIEKGNDSNRLCDGRRCIGTAAVQRMVIHHQYLINIPSWRALHRKVRSELFRSCVDCRCIRQFPSV